MIRPTLNTAVHGKQHQALSSRGIASGKCLIVAPLQRKSKSQFERMELSHRRNAMQKRIEPAHREFFLTKVCDDGRRMTYYNGCCYRSLRTVTKDAKLYGSRCKGGKIIVEHIDRPESEAWETTLAL
jgi:hypothetical protein